MRITALVASAVLAHRAVSGPVYPSSSLKNNPREIQKHEIEDLPPISTFVTPWGIIEPIPELPEETTATGLPFDSRPDNLENFPTIVDDIPDDGHNETNTTVSVAHSIGPTSDHALGEPTDSSTNVAALQELVDQYISMSRDDKNSKLPSPDFLENLQSAVWGAQLAETPEGNEAQHVGPRSIGWELLWEKQFGPNVPRPDTVSPKNKTSKRALCEGTSSYLFAPRPTNETSPSRTNQPTSVESSISQFSLAYCPGESGWIPASQFVDTKQCALVHYGKPTSKPLERRQDDPPWLSKFLFPELDNSLPKRDERGWDIEGSMNSERENPETHETTDVNLDVDWWSAWKRDHASAAGENRELQRRDVAGKDISIDANDSDIDDVEIYSEGRTPAHWREFESNMVPAAMAGVAPPRTGESNMLQVMAALALHRAGHANTAGIAPPRVGDVYKCYIMSQTNKASDECFIRKENHTTRHPGKQIVKRDLAGQVEKFENEIGAEIKKPFAELKNATVGAFDDAEVAIEDVVKRFAARVKKFKSKSSGKMNVTAIFEAPYFSKREVSESVMKAEHDIAARVRKEYNGQSIPSNELEYTAGIISSLAVDNPTFVEKYNSTGHYRSSHYLKRDLAEDIWKLNYKLGDKINKPFKPFNFTAFNHFIHKPWHKHNTTSFPRPVTLHKNTTRQTTLAVDGEAAYCRFHSKDFKPSTHCARGVDVKVDSEQGKGYPKIRPEQEFSQEKSEWAFKQYFEKLAMKYKPHSRLEEAEPFTPEAQEMYRKKVQEAYAKEGFDPSKPVVAPEPAPAEQ
jgi:hypothetical protein